MPADRLLATLLRALQHSYAPEQTSKLLSTASSLLSILSNPLNITLLTSQLLTAPAIWSAPDGLHTCLQVLQLFYAGLASLAPRSRLGSSSGRAVANRSGLSSDQWVRAVLTGADRKSPRWRHLLPLAGMLLAVEKGPGVALGAAVRQELVEAWVRALEMALQELKDAEGLPAHCIALTATYVVERVPERQRRLIDYKALLPVLVKSAFFSQEGFYSAYFLGVIDAQVVQTNDSQFTWPAQCSSHLQLQQMCQRPLHQSMGPLARLISQSVSVVPDPDLVYQAVQELLLFTKILSAQWRLNKLSEIDVSEESVYLDHEALHATTPHLWQVLKTAMFSCITILAAVVKRTLSDRSLSQDHYAPFIATAILHIERHLFFITSRLGPTSISSNVFVYLSAIDILTQYREHALAFVTDIRPRPMGAVPRHPLDRCLDHFFLNTAEHFTLVLSPAANEDLLVGAAQPYLSPDASGGGNGGADAKMTELFEAAHSVMLAVLSAPPNADLSARVVASYVDALLAAFPHRLSARQFRLAYKTVVRLASPPSPLSVAQPDLASELLEVLRHRAAEGMSCADAAASSSSSSVPPEPPQAATLILAIIDSLPFLAPALLDQWLPLAAELIHISTLHHPPTADLCRRRFWDVLSSGEMDVARAERCVVWWGTRGGREMVLFGAGAKEDEDEGREEEEGPEQAGDGHEASSAAVRAKL
ncbi:MAG: hypothetical protein M1826_005073 [Phylliscum demangeonii]|nr:MAG: hypothetical protein M1826_005073 [Phylliscum demangeonii]